MTDQVFEPARLRLARELREWSQADLAARLGVTAAAVSQFENGVTGPSPETVTRLSRLLEVPPDFFRAPLVETHEGFFRSLRRTSVGHRRRARAVAQIAHDIAAHDAVAGLLPPVTIPSAPAIGLDASLAEIEGIAAGVRRECGLACGPVPNVVQVLESHGVLVIRLPLDTADVDAFSLPFPDRPVVVLGADKNDKARSRFDASHELGHLVMHGEQVWGLKEVEQQAHAFAAAFLMPAEDIYAELPERVDWPRLFELKRRWQVSLAALLMRAKTLGCMGESQYLTAVKAASARGWRRVEPVPLGHPERPSQLRSIVRTDAGKRLASVLPTTVVEALISANTA
jgi:Zn-dependent peptidase ImmA (M78 family)/transcriptional regulator with XRE-family HTH domain